MQIGGADNSGLEVPLLLLALRVGWVASMRPTLGVCFVVPYPSAALSAFAPAVSGASWRLLTGARALCVLRAVSLLTWRLFTGAHAVRRTRVLLVASLGSLPPCYCFCVSLLLLDAIVLLFLLFPFCFADAC